MLSDKPKTTQIPYKPPLNVTSTSVQSYQPPYYNDPAVYSSDYEPHQYSGEQLVSRGAPTKTSPPSTSGYHDMQMTGSGYMRPTSDPYLAGKYEGYKETSPTIFPPTGTSMLAGSYGNSEVSYLYVTTMCFNLVTFY